jgi:hypothetical protein
VGTDGYDVRVPNRTPYRISVSVTVPYPYRIRIVSNRISLKAIRSGPKRKPAPAEFYGRKPLSRSLKYH